MVASLPSGLNSKGQINMPSTKTCLFFTQKHIDYLYQVTGLPRHTKLPVVVREALANATPDGWRHLPYFRQDLIIALCQMNIELTGSQQYDAVVGTLNGLGIDANFMQVAKVWERHGNHDHK